MGMQFSLNRFRDALGGLRRLSITRMLLAVVSIALASDVAVAKQFLDDGSTDVTVVAHKSTVVEIPRPYAQALIADEKIADLVPITDRLVYIVGKKVGATSLVLIDPQKNVIVTANINVTHNLADLRAKLRENLPRNRIRVSGANGRILLSGTVQDARAVKKALMIANQYAPDSVTNALDVRATQQVMLEVRFVEASRRAATELGVSTRVRSARVNSDTGGQALVTGSLISAASLASGAQPFGSLIAKLLKGGTNVDVIVRALEERGLARRLAEPNLVTMSGVSASFLAGGEFPFPVDSSDGKVTVAFKTFGVALKFTPTVLSDGLINLQIEPEVSELDDTAGVAIADVRIPGLVVRRAQTAVELRDGQSFAIAGLLQHSNTRLSRQLPWIGKVPVLGALFRSAQYKKQETDLVIIITPRLVRPARPGEPLTTPLQGSRGSGQRELFLRGKHEKNSWQASVVRGHNDALPLQPGHIISLTKIGHTKW